MEAVTPAKQERPPLFRLAPCECGEQPLLIEGVYTCTNPGCPHYEEEAWEAP